MDISSTKGSGAPLTDNKKLMVIKVYNYFSGANSKKEDHQKVTLRKHVAEQEIIDWLHAHDIAFSDELRKPELLELVRMNKEKVPFACVKIAEAIIVGLWRRAIKNTKEYFESDENIQFTDDEFDAYSSFDDDHVI
ncbi:uncharacterized protein OCT59_011994 [Rhizophagus irregularis]|uniref:uncharacterized protein n=1 Tax=Rhizophagus irregularis TaxID=588596 RepID=UPI00331C8BCA|nr:hypothetical protein OCT59_011994 [Rhizophagus irregularis]